MTLWIGLSGSIGSGKSTAATCFAKLGVPILSADKISHALTEPDGGALPLIRAHFGDNLFLSDGSLDRQQLRVKVFSDPQSRIALETILHPMIWQNLQQEKQNINRNVHYGIIEIPLLAEKPIFQQLVQRVLIIEASIDNCIHRIQQRSGLDESTARAIIAQQASSESRQIIADDIISNDGDWHQLNQQVIHQHSIYQALNPLQS